MRSHADDEHKTCDIRHNSSESTWLSAGTPFYTVKSVIQPEMDQEEDEELPGISKSEHRVGHNYSEEHYNGREDCPQQIRGRGTVAH